MRRLLACFALGCCAMAAHADGGRLQMRQAAGPFVVSLFTAPESPAVGPADLSVMVEEQGSVLLDANVVVTLTPEDADVAPVVARLSYAHADEPAAAGCGCAVAACRAVAGCSPCERAGSRGERRDRSDRGELLGAPGNGVVLCRAAGMCDRAVRVGTDGEATRAPPENAQSGVTFRPVIAIVKGLPDAFL